MKRSTKATRFKIWLWVEIAAALLLTVWVKFPYLLCGVSKKALAEHLVAIVSIWAVIAIGGCLLFALVRRAGASTVKVGVITAVTVAAGLLTAFVSSPYLLPKQDYVAVDIIAGQRTENSQGNGSEVWLSWCENAYKQLNLSQQTLIKQVNFEYIEEGDAFAYLNRDGSGAGLLRFVFSGDEQLTLRFAKSEWSGVVSVVNHATGETTEFDLCPAENDYEFQSYTILPGNPLTPWKRIGMTVLYALCFSALLQSLVFAGIVLTRLARHALADKHLMRQALGRHAIPGLAIALVPITALLFLYGENSPYVDFGFLMLLACAITILLLLYYVLIDLAYHSPLAGAIAGIIVTLFLFFYYSAAQWLEVPRVSYYIQINGVLLIGGMGAVLTLLCFMLAKNRQVNRLVVMFSGLFVGMLFVFNLGNSIAIYGHQSDVSQSLIKPEYNVEERSPADKPNVYWLHFDGMMGFSAIEKYYGDPQMELEQALADRGIKVNRNAFFIAGHQTDRCLPALLSPEFYDYQYAGWQQIHTQNPSVTFEDYYRDISIATMGMQQVNAEMFAAFKTTDYRLISMVEPNVATVIITAGETQYITPDAQLIQTTPKTPGSALRLAGEVTKLYQIKAFCEAFLPPVSLMIDVEDFRENNFVQKNIMTLEDDLINTTTCQALDYVSSEETEPFICFAAFMQAHVPYINNEDGVPTASASSPTSYYTQYIYTTKVMLQAIDTIIANDPDAVIVVQADHGINGELEPEFYATFGEQGDIGEILNSTMSGIRVPEKYQNGEEAYALQNPLNMSRYLVNNFVGHNYTYLAEQ